MAECMLTSRGETRARLMAGELERKGIPATLRRLPAELTREGCVYGVSVPSEELPRAMHLLRVAGFPPRRAFVYGADGWREADA